ncbi:hypothetical protein TrRE_jg10696, partial [Triparma retinervis]
MEHCDKNKPFDNDGLRVLQQRLAASFLYATLTNEGKRDLIRDERDKLPASSRDMWDIEDDTPGFSPNEPLADGLKGLNPASVLVGAGVSPSLMHNGHFSRIKDVIHAIPKVQPTIPFSILLNPGLALSDIIDDYREYVKMPLDLDDFIHMGSGSYPQGQSKS